MYTLDAFRLANKLFLFGWGLKQLIEGRIFPSKTLPCRSLRDTHKHNATLEVVETIAQTPRGKKIRSDMLLRVTNHTEAG